MATQQHHARFTRAALLAAHLQRPSAVVDGDDGKGDDEQDADLTFQALTWHAVDEEEVVAGEGDDDGGGGGGGDDDGDPSRQRRPTVRYVLRAFGVDGEGRSVCLRVDGFTPFLYVKLPVAMCKGPRRSFVIQTLLAYLETYDAVGVKGVKATHLRKKEYLGFSDGEQFDFVRLTFSSRAAMRRAASRLSKPQRVRQLGGAPVTLLLYESNMDPMLRFLHVRGLRPVGWLVAKGAVEDTRGSSCQRSFSADWRRVSPLADAEQDRRGQAPLLIAGFDIECNSAHGDFPVAKKDYRRLAIDLEAVWSRSPGGVRGIDPYVAAERLEAVACAAFGLGDKEVAGVSRLELKRRPAAGSEQEARLAAAIKQVVFEVLELLREGDKADALAKRGVRAAPTAAKAAPAEKASDRYGDKACEQEEQEDHSTIGKLTALLNRTFAGQWPLHGDAVIQIGLTVGVYGVGNAPCCSRHILTLGTCEPIDGADVRTFEKEEDMLLTFVDLVRSIDPDVMLGYNIFGFDLAYLHDRAGELMGEARREARFHRFGRVEGLPSAYVEQKLSSSALGDNVLKYLDMHGRVVVDLMKVVQRDHRLDSYKLDTVAEHFLGDRKHDVSPADVFRMQRGSAADRRVIAEYCIQDCELCNRLAAKLEILANNAGMANVCLVPLSFIFMRGQGVKIFSLVAKRCRDDGFLVPTRQRFGDGAGDEEEEEEGYEGAIVLEPEVGMYLEDPVAVLDYNSLYPSSMISHNLSHDSIVIDPAYDRLPGVEYAEIVYDRYEGKGDEKRVVGKQVCRFARNTTATPGVRSPAVLPRILMDLLAQRKATRALMKGVDDEFRLAVLDGLQLAYKVTANSLYGQMGARTSPLYLKHIAACTTAVGRSMIMQAKAYIEDVFRARVIYGDTDSIFIVFNNVDPVTGEKLKGRDALASSIKQGQAASDGIKPLLAYPHCLAYEKNLFPLLLLSKKRYTGFLYEDDADAKPQQKSMGIALKRRDYAPIVKQIYGGVIDIILTDRDLPKAVAFLKSKLKDLGDGRYELEDLVISKNLRGYYKFPAQIAHWVLAQRMFARDPGSAPQVSDRIPYVFVRTAKPNALMGDRIEHVDFVRKAIAAGDKRTAVDIPLYITSQIQKPCLQLLGIALEKIPGYVFKEELSGPKALAKLVDAKNGNVAKARERLDNLREKEVERLVFTPALARCNGQTDIHRFYSAMPAESLNRYSPAS